VTKAPPARCVVDTNVAVTANGGQPAASRECIDASARSLQRIISGGHLFIDQAGQIVQEYRDNLDAKGQPGPGDAFLKWVLTHEWGAVRITRVALTPSEDNPNRFTELPAPLDDVRYDPSDCKFLAVSAAHPQHPAILQATDSKWWGWRASLAKAGVSVHFLCSEIGRNIRRRWAGERVHPVSAHTTPSVAWLRTTSERQGVDRKGAE
jgi:hypothetical protein